MRKMKGVRQKPNGRYIVDVCVAGVRRTATCRTLDEAIIVHRKMELEAELASLGVKTEMRENPEREMWTLEEAYDYCRQTRWKTLRNKQSMETKINAIIKFFGKNTPIDTITTKRVDEFVASLIEDHKPGTINLYLSGLSTVLRMAQDRDMLDKLPKIPHIKNKAKRHRFLSPEEEKRILDLLDTYPEVRDMVIVLIDTGMRISELLGLKPKDIDLERKLITIWKTKTDKPRTIPMTERVYAIINERLTDRINIKKYERRVFPMSIMSFRYRWKCLRKTLGYESDPDFVPHMLRHTCCSRLIQNGAEIVKTSAWMGHSNISTTMVYAHLAPDSLIKMKHLLEQ